MVITMKGSKRSKGFKDSRCSHFQSGTVSPTQPEEASQIHDEGNRHMNVSIEKKREEAIKRMQMLGIFRETIRQFKDENYVSISEPPHGAFYWAQGEDLKRIKQFEKEHNALVFVVIRSYTNAGKIDSMLFVSDNPEEWWMERTNLMFGMTPAYLHCFDAPNRSGVSIIGIARTAGSGPCLTYCFPGDPNVS